MTILGKNLEYQNDAQFIQRKLEFCEILLLLKIPVVGPSGHSSVWGNQKKKIFKKRTRTRVLEFSQSQQTKGRPGQKNHQDVHAGGQNI